MAVVTNVELDHHTTFATLGELQEAFDEFTAGARVVIADVEEPEVELLPLGSRFAALGASSSCGAGPAQRPERARGRARLPRGGRRAGGVGEGAAVVPGAGRRFESHGTGPGGSQVYDDYAHQPTEVRATLEAARTLGAERVVACFQPHLYSRTQHLARDFGRALALADMAVVLDVYPARERADDFPGVSGWLVAAAAADAAGGRPCVLDAGPGRRRAAAARRAEGATRC